MRVPLLTLWYERISVDMRSLQSIIAHGRIERQRDLWITGPILGQNDQKVNPCLTSRTIHEEVRETYYI